MSERPLGERGSRPFGEEPSGGRERRLRRDWAEPEEPLPVPHADLRARRQPEPAPSPLPQTPSSRTVIRFGVAFKSLGTVFGVAIVMATIFTWWTPTAFLPPESVAQLSVVLATQVALTPSPSAPVVAIAPTEAPLNRIGIISGHRGLHPATGQPDPGAICPDGLTEAEVNEAVATRVVELLRGEGYDVDLLDEWDSRLTDYRGLALVSIHADSCDYINELATGFKVASFAESVIPEEDARLVSCLIARYEETTGLTFHPSVTYDMTQYHTFREVDPRTPGAIIEIGFLNLDRDLLTEHPDTVALGIARGLICYLEDEPVFGATPAPTLTRVP
jgi:N-acetylmuramoyl-L-alanine amidase